MITCLVQELQYALSAISPTIGNETNGHLGIRIKSHSKKDRVKLSSTEGSFATEIWIDATVRTPLDFVVEGDRFARYIAKLDAKEASLIVEDDTLTVKSKRGKPTFSACDPEKFPVMPKSDPDVSFSLAGKVFKNIVLGVAFATKPEKKNESQPLTEGIHIVSDGKKLILTAMNGFVIANYRKNIKTSEIDLTVAKKSMVNAARLVKDTDKVTVQAEDSRLIVKHNDISYYIPVYVGEYPQIDVETDSFDTTLLIDKGELLGVLDRGISMLEESGSTKATLDVVKGKMVIEGATQRTKFHETLDTTFSGAKASVRIDLKRTTEILRNMDADRILIGIDKGKPITIRPQTRTDHTCLLAIG